ncbi:MAG: aminotransferase class V-fold PLP-dependent enzyme [Simkaniaceae bacterium]|nr:aminotransferase class V-fold PLP-dependent enzyme [Simkaniaceae bacterium]MCF7852574.1 aminotransferase class V-fold PLP-dependent enzyme [Simkaniaceae bacterium]
MNTKESLTAPAFQNAKLQEDILSAIESLYDLVGASADDQFVLTSSNAESVTQVFYHVYFEHILKTGKNQILISNLESASTLLNAARLEAAGCRVDEVSVNSEGLITPSILNLHTSPKTSILFISLVNPLTGVIQPITEIAAYCHRHNILLHVNLSDAIGGTYFHFDEYPIDTISFDATSIGGPRGLGALFVKKGKKISPLIPTAERINPSRGGAFEPEQLLQFKKAACTLKSEFDSMTLNAARLRDRFEAILKDRIPDVVIPFEQQLRVAHLSTICFPGVAQDLMLFHLAHQNINASMGGGETQKLQHLLTKCGMDATLARSSLSFNMFQDRDEERLDYMVEIIVDTYYKLRKISCGLSFEEED